MWISMNVNNDHDFSFVLQRRFHDCVDWLNEELNRRSFAVANQVYYNNWSPPAPSNETSNGYYLERSASARLTLDKALELCPDEVHIVPTLVLLVFKI